MTPLLTDDELPKPRYYVVNGYLYTSRGAAENCARMISPTEGESLPVDALYTAEQMRAYARAVEARVREKMDDGWIACSERMPKAETPVLVYIKGRVRTGELRWETPTYEETFAPYMYWDDPDDDGQMWEWDDVTHWRPLPPLPSNAGEKR